MLFHTFSIKASGGGAWLASHTGRFIPTEIDPVTLECQNWASPRAIFEMWGLNSVPLLENEFGCVGRPAHSRVTTLQRHLFLYLQNNCLALRLPFVWDANHILED